MLEKRNIAVEIILSIVTCGIYAIVWFIRLTNDVKSAAGDEKFQSGGVAFLLTLITCGIYGIIWMISINDDVNSILMDLPIETYMKEEIASIMFGDTPIKNKRISIRKLKNKKLSKEYIALFLKLLEYISEF